MLSEIPLKDLLAFITGAGFAAFVAIWFMLRLEKHMVSLIKGYGEMCDLIKKNNVATGLMCQLIAVFFRENGVPVRQRDMTEDQRELGRELQRKGKEL